MEGRAPVIILAAPLIALTAVRNRRWAVDIHVSRDVVFQSFTLIGSGIFLLAIALIGGIFRRGGSEWGSVVETSMIFAAILAIAITLTSGSARSRIRSVLVENFFSSRFDYRREWMRCIDALTAPEAFVALHKRAIRAAAEVVDSPAGALFVRAPKRRRVSMGRLLEFARGDQPGCRLDILWSRCSGTATGSSGWTSMPKRIPGFPKCRGPGWCCRSITSAT